jgi:hypothetical protein
VSDAWDFHQRLELFFGASSDAISRVYARLEGVESAGDFQLAGTLTGPSCADAETLPATSRFVDRGPGESLLAEALVPEPCFWTPQTPHLYRADVQLQDSGGVVAQEKRMFGIRPLGAAGRKLIYAGKNWVLRGIAADELPKTDLAAWHNAETAMCVRNPDDALCEAASRVGVLVIADLEAAETREIRRLSRWPAVGFIVLPNDAKPERRGLGHNVVLTQRFAAAQPISPASWAGAAMLEFAATDELPGGLPDCPIPLIVARRSGELPSIAAGRTACDRLQRDLAVHGQFAGYIV